MVELIYYNQYLKNKASYPEKTHFWVSFPFKDTHLHRYMYMYSLLIASKGVQGRHPGNFYILDILITWRWQFQQQNMIPIDRGKEIVSKIYTHTPGGRRHLHL